VFIDWFRDKNEPLAAQPLSRPAARARPERRQCEQSCQSRGRIDSPAMAAKPSHYASTQHRVRRQALIAGRPR
jgi:hypothetical protein